MELSAFAHLTKRNIKVVQPGLVYVIQCESPKTSLVPTSIIKQEEDEQPMDLDGFNDRERRRIRREKRRADDVEEEGEPLDGGDEDGTSGPTIYVASVNISIHITSMVLYLLDTMTGNTSPLSVTFEAPMLGCHVFRKRRCPMKTAISFPRLRQYRRMRRSGN